MASGRVWAVGQADEAGRDGFTSLAVRASGFRDPGRRSWGKLDDVAEVEAGADRADGGKGPHAKGARGANVGVRIDGVSKAFGSVRALVGATLELEPGKISAFVGPNGSGKSTLLGIVATLVRASHGRVQYTTSAECKNGRPEMLSRASVRKHIGWLGHELGGYADLTVRENVALAARWHGLDPDRSWDRVAMRFELAPLADRVLRGCSRGQRQRAALGRALVHDPTLLLLDEPLTGLDAAGRARVVEAVRERAAAGATVVVVSHDEALGSMAERRFAFSRGRVTEV